MLSEVAPPGFGHTKGDEKKGVKKGGTAAAFDRARKEGRFKGSKSDMFAIMWSQKNKGDKPHYKPGTDKKYKKYQKESVDLEEKAFADFYKKAKSIVIKKKQERKPEKAMDAGAKARRVLKRKEHAKYVSGSTDNVPDDIRDHKEYK
jgi:hypothetical protein